MAFLETLRRMLAGGRSAPEPQPSGTFVMEPGGPGGPPGGPSAPAVDYDRAQWHKKMKRVLEELPDSRGEWPDLKAEAKALGFDPKWVAAAEHEEFLFLVRRAVSDRVVTDAEHRKLDLARDLIGIPDSEAEAALLSIAAEAEAFFDEPAEEG